MLRPLLSRHLVFRSVDIMKTKRFKTSLTAVLLALGLSSAAPILSAEGGVAEAPQTAEPREYALERHTLHMGTLINAKLFGATPEAVKHYAIVFEDKVTDYDDLMSVHKDTPLNEVNRRAGEPVEVPCEIADMTKQALAIADETNGAFEPMIGPVVNLWKIGFGGEHVPSDEAIAEAVSKVDRSKVRVWREGGRCMMQIAKGLGISIFIVGHVTKEGVVAGPRVLEHMVDTVLYFEGDRHAAYRILRSVKNRFGSTNEIGVFEMQQVGLVEVENPSEYMLNGRPEGASGSIVTCSIEGTRPILLEIQALVCKTGFGLPRRTAAGADLNRVNLLMAVLEKRAGIPLSSCDAYVNIAGGIRMNEPAIDLGIILAIVSSYRELAISDKTICFGEVGLSGEVRAVNMAKQRVQEAKKLGFETCILPKVSLTDEGGTDGIRLIGVSNVREAIFCISDGEQ